MSPSVSVIIPCYNAAPWIGAAIESVLAQTHPAVELIVVDDGSSDNSLTIASTYEQRGVRVLSRINGGAAAARNTGIHAATGDYLQFLDADDLLSPHKIERQLALLSARPVGTLATCRWGRFETNPAAARFVDHSVFRDFSSLDYLLAHVGDAATMHPAAWLVPRVVANSAGPWDESLSLNDDGEYFARVVLASAGLAFATELDAATYYRSSLAGSLSARRSPHALTSLERSVALVAVHLAAAEDSPRVRRALANYWLRLCYELYPDSPNTSRTAAARAAALGGSDVPPPMGRHLRLFSHLFGWRAAKRLRGWIARASA